jgi:uncharacterized membrane protein YhaH (DUF805 family)
MSWYIEALKKYALFKGRARRREFWMFTLFNIIFIVASVILDDLLGTVMKSTGFGIIYTVYVLAVLVPGFAVAVRRLHDLGKSGWWWFVNLIPFVGSIWFIVLMVTDGQPAENKYGPNPKETVVPMTQQAAHM